MKGSIDSVTAFHETFLSARRTMFLSEMLKLALENFRTAKLRFALTALGMVIGTTPVILVVTLGLTGKQIILNEIQKIGTNSVELEYTDGGAVGAERTIYNDNLTRNDEKAVLAQMLGVLQSSPVTEMHTHISVGEGVVKDTLVLGVSPQCKDIRNMLVPVGRILYETDNFAHIKCAVVTKLFARQILGNPDAAVGKNFEINGIPFTIIGIFKESIDTFGQAEIAYQSILIPYLVARYFTGSENVNQICFSMRSMAEVPDAASELVRIVQMRHRANSVYIAQTLKEVLTMAATIANALTAILVLVAFVTLTVGGVDIMNIMLANVTSRIHEIGIRRALGAIYREIKLQFLLDAIIISLAGVLVGTIVGLIQPLSVRFFTDYDLPFSWLSVFIVFAAATLVGGIFGTVPATRAAQLDPVEALKHE